MADPAPGGERAFPTLSLFVRHQRLPPRAYAGASGAEPGNPLRIFYAFDPRRTAILLIGGDKMGRNRFYEEMVPQADALYDTRLEELRKEGLI